ncbi:MAG: methyl-accepting chemotaxis protein [Desulfovibrio sp.]|jgi:methyl-accepting chemotaxis protein|nr:methyl-accepting chemotaxis protein [Desulfovibrio sp.]
MRLSLRTKILGPVVVLIALAVSGSAMLSYRNSSDALRDALADNMRGEAAALVRAIDDMTDTVVHNIAQIPLRQEIQAFYRGDTENRAAGEAMGEALRKIVDTYRGFERVSLLNMKGKVVASSTASAIGQDFSDRNYFKNALKGRAFLSQPLKSRVSGTGVMIAAAPVKMDGSVVGVAYAAVSLDDFFKKFVEPVVVGSRGYAFVLAQNGQVAIHKDSGFLFRDDLSTMPVFKEIVAQKKPGVKEYQGIGGRQVYNYYAQDEGSGLTVIVQAESDDAFSALVQLRNESLVVGCVSVVAGAVIIFILLNPVLNVLGRCIVFAGQVADGDFSGRLACARADELGRLADALRSIPEKLQKVLAMADALAGKIRSGRFRERLDASALHGSYAALADSINTVARSYTDVIDIVPPFMTCDKDHTILFLNESAQAVVGGDHSGTKCSGHFQSPECNTEKCRGLACMRQGKVMQETFISPVSGRSDVSVTALPITGEKGECLGYYEFLSDVTQIKGIQKAVTKAAEQAADIADHVASASENLSKKVEEVLRGANVERERMGTTAAGMAEMNSTVLEVARNAANASEQCEATRGKAETGARLVDRVVEAISSVNSVATSLQENMHDLGRRAESIGGVMNVISDIADQTNLLALNAAIEAARAGEAGRGFAVVADEVRKLAEKTMTATQEVGHNISGIQHSAKINIEEVEKAVASIAEATELASDSGRALSEIVQLAAVNSSVVTSIATAAEEQRAASEEINHSVEEVNRIVTETAVGMDQAAASVQELAGMAHSLNQVVGSLKSS